MSVAPVRASAPTPVILAVAPMVRVPLLKFSVVALAMLNVPLSVPLLAIVRLPPTTLTLPVLLKPPSAFRVSASALFLLNVPLLLKMLPPPVCTNSEPVLVPPRLQVPALLITPPPLKRTRPAPLTLTTPVAVLFQVRARKRSPPRVVAAVVVSVPVPSMLPALNVAPPARVMLPLPLSVPPLWV